ncbi:LuxR C-terminal-related transcriptional regulator [Erythrobacter sp. CCH5-A1]|jgi:DNA-binding CsgD family transcriptional regulator|uniref:LuxR C-terminal-related transcriptional regulator n=1 Tax=Erythrobacter sp. CCH5-A1 TaxID=1768792 RepID=UPI00082DF12A|nr:LuxR C-terminal-related transcriptional regulator [Erythrobacter sp. CCH5-A1]
MTASDTICRLTEREKEVLRAWLAHKSAKEIAIDLGITHHAVEKRLKMARTKLGAATSLEAARMLAEAEGASDGYGQAVTAPPDLPEYPTPLPSRRYRPIILGGIAMLTLTVLGLALAAAYPSAEPTEIEVDGNFERVFAYLDRNKSGYLESPESPFVAIAFVDPNGGDSREGSAVIGNSDDPAQVTEFYTAADTDRDGRVSFAEYEAWSEARWAELGIELKTIIKVLPDS